MQSRTRFAVLVLAFLSSPVFAFELSSPSISEGNWDKKFLATECGGQNVSPVLEWKDAPAGTRSFVLTMFDRDALEGFGWWHWQVLGIPSSSTGLAEGAGSRQGKLLPKGAIQGTADLGRAGYLGPCARSGTDPHHFVFTLYALKSAKPETERAASPGMIVADIIRDSIAKASIAYVYQP